MDKDSLREITQDVLYGLPTALIIFDKERHILWTNNKAKELLGHKDLTKKNYSDLFSEGSKNYIDKAFKKLIKEDKKRLQLPKDLSLIDKDGNIFYVEGILHKIYKNDTIFITFFFTRNYSPKKREFNFIKLNQIIEQSEDAIVITDLDGNILYVNPAFTKLTGYSKDEVIGKNMNILKSGKHDELFYKKLWDTIKNGKAWRGQIINKRKDGTLYYEENTIFPIFNIDKDIVNFTAIKKDYTSIMKFQEKIRHLSTFPEEEPNPIVEMKLDGTVIYANPAAKKILKTREILDFSHPLLNGIKQKIKNSNTNNIPIDEVSIEGAVYERKISYFPEKGILRIYFYNITKRKEIEKILKKRNKSLREALDTILTMTKKNISTDEELDKFIKEIIKKSSHLINADKVNFLIFNSKKNELIPKYIYLKKEDTFIENGFIASVDSVPLYFQMIKDRNKKVFVIDNKSNPEVRNEIDNYIKTKSKNSVLRSFSSIDIPIKSGDELIGVISFESFDRDRNWILYEELLAKYISDLIALKIEQKTRIQTEKKLIKAKKEAEIANRAKSEFLSRMSHELRTPLNAILGFSQILDEGMLGELTDEQKEAVKDILKSGKHLLELVNDILDISRIESERITLSIESVSLYSLTLEVIKFMKTSAEKRKIKLINNIEKDIYVKADYTRLRQVLINIVSNAIKYNKDEGYVKLTSEKEDNNAKIIIEDSGLGIPKDKINNLFEPFNRLGRELSNIEGTGIGLTITKKLIELMGGDIYVKSILGVGTTIIIKIPASQPPVKEYDTDEKDFGMKKYYKENKTILYIEDNLSNTKLVNKILAVRPNVKLISTSQGRIGIELAISHKPDLILTDINLPDIDGYEVFKRLKEHPELKDTPVIAVSADIMEDNKKKIEKRGFSGFLEKPLNVKKFLSLIDKYLID